MRGVILYGPPAAGKSTVTAALCRSDETFVAYERLKAGGGRTAGYRMIESTDLVSLRSGGRVVWENDQYGSTYVIERDSLLSELEAGRVPVVHLGQPEGVAALRAALPSVRWLVVYLSCPRETAVVRLAGRGDGDVRRRLEVWDNTPRLAAPDLEIDTSTVAIGDAAQQVADGLARPNE